MTLQERARQLSAARPRIDQRIRAACKGAALRAVERAVDLTPPSGALSGTHTRTGEMKQDWAASSTVEPRKKGDAYETVLANSKEYASYVNDGHRMDRHFVPGLYISGESGLLAFDPSKKGGVVVGAKTHYVPGIFMADEAKEEYRRVLRAGLAELGEILK